MFNYACDIDVYDWWAHIVADKPFPTEFKRKYHCAFVGRKYDRPYLYSHDDLVSRLGPSLVHVQDMNPIEYSVMGNVGYLVRSADQSEMLALVRCITTEAAR